jgi:hypothetical protein
MGLALATDQQNQYVHMNSSCFLVVLYSFLSSNRLFEPQNIASGTFLPIADVGLPWSLIALPASILVQLCCTCLQFCRRHPQHVAFKPCGVKKRKQLLNTSDTNPLTGCLAYRVHIQDLSSQYRNYVTGHKRCLEQGGMAVVNWRKRSWLSWEVCTC